MSSELNESHDTHSSGASGIESLLSALRPVPSGIDRDRVMYLAGRAAQRRADRRAKALSLSTAAASLLFGVGCLALMQARAAGTPNAPPPVVSHEVEPSRARQEADVADEDPDHRAEQVAAQPSRAPQEAVLAEHPSHFDHSFSAASRFGHPARPWDDVPLASLDYFQLRDRVLRYGFDSLPAFDAREPLPEPSSGVAYPPIKPMTYGDWLREYRLHPERLERDLALPPTSFPGENS
ncbi:MAG: hypothetical protein WD066_10255 [Planctomycetaceae bacterium]